MVADIKEVNEVIYGMMTDRQKEFCKTYFELGGDRKAIAKRMGMNRNSVDRYIRGEREPLVRVIVLLNNLSELDLKHHSKISPEWLEAEAKEMYDNAKTKMVETDKPEYEGDKERDRKYYEKMMQEYFQQLKDLEYKFQDMEKDDMVKLIGLNPSQLLGIVNEVKDMLETYIKKHAWEKNE
jgi:transcriptional regulator with XRE-family HTH domain